MNLLASPYELKLPCAFIELRIHVERLLSANDFEHPVQLRFIVLVGFCCIRASMTDLRSV